MLEEYSGHVQDSGEGRWTIMAAIEEAVPADVLSAALYTRFRSRQFICMIGSIPSRSNSAATATFDRCGLKYR